MPRKKTKEPKASKPTNTAINVLQKTLEKSITTAEQQFEKLRGRVALEILVFSEHGFKNVPVRMEEDVLLLATAYDKFLKGDVFAKFSAWCKNEGYRFKLWQTDDGASKIVRGVLMEW